MKKIISLLLIVFSVTIIIIVVFNSQIVKNTTITFNDKDLKFEDSPFYKKYYNSSNIVVVTIWATWCKPCMEEIPLLNKLKNDYNKEGLDFISYSIDSAGDIEKLEKFIASKKFKWTDITIENLEYKKCLENLFYKKPASSNAIQVTSFEIPKTLIFKDRKLIKEYQGLIDYDNISKFLHMELRGE